MYDEIAEMVIRLYLELKGKSLTFYECTKTIKINKD